MFGMCIISPGDFRMADENNIDMLFLTKGFVRAKSAEKFLGMSGVADNSIKDNLRLIR